MPIATRIRIAAAAHGVWRLTLRNAVEQGGADLDPELFGREDSCDFGRWCQSPELPTALRCSPAAREAEQHHADLHACACAMLHKLRRGDRAGALADLEPGGALYRADRALAVALEAWELEVQDVAA